MTNRTPLKQWLQGRKLAIVAVLSVVLMMMTGFVWNKNTVYIVADGQQYTVQTEAGETVKTVHAPQNYRLEVEQLGRCILDGEKIHVSRDFSVMNSRLLQRILEKIGY